MKRKALALLVTAIMVLGTAAPSFAAAETRNITANYSGIALYVDLEPVTLLDVNGDPVDPFISDGTTYLPVRAVSGALGMDVEWEAAAKTVHIAVKAAEDETAAATEDEAAVETAAEPFIGVRTLAASFDDIKINVNGDEIAPKDAAGVATPPFISGGTTYLPVRAVAEAFGLPVSWDGATKSVYIGEQPGTAVDEDLYGKYVEASAAIEAAGSYAAAINGSMTVTMGEARIEAAMSGSAKLVINGDTDFELEANTVVSVADEEDMTSNVYYKDGFMYMEAAGEKIKMAVPIDEALKLARTGNFDFDESAIKAQTVTDSGYSFTLDGAKLTNLAETALSSLGSASAAIEANYKFDDVECAITLGDDGALKSVNMVFACEVAPEDPDAEAMALDYNITMEYTQVGGVKITPPADLSSYEELKL
jgi:hypothetical protein